jgi:hypothetical protein
MKIRWVDIARLVAPAAMFIPGAAPLVPIILTGINEADKMFGTDPQSEAQKRSHVFKIVAEGAQGVTEAGLATIDPGKAQMITESVFMAVDQVKAIMKDQAEKADPTQES